MARATDNYGYNISRRRRPCGRVDKTVAAAAATAASRDGIQRALLKHKFFLPPILPFFSFVSLYLCVSILPKSVFFFSSSLFTKSCFAFLLRRSRAQRSSFMFRPPFSKTSRLNATCCRAHFQCHRQSAQKTLSLSLLTVTIIFVMIKWIKYPFPLQLRSSVPACVTGSPKQCSNRVSNWSDIV